jgi:hypothetical protein
MGLYFVNRSTPNYDTILCRQICTGLLRRQHVAVISINSGVADFISKPLAKNGNPL